MGRRNLKSATMSENLKAASLILTRRGIRVVLWESHSRFEVATVVE